MLIKNDKKNTKFLTQPVGRSIQLMAVGETTVGKTSILKK
jgi:hypothetical protein